MSDGSAYTPLTGNTVVVENLLFVIDYADAFAGMQGSPTYLALNHTRSDGTDILRYEYTEDDGHGGVVTKQSYNNLCNSYPIAPNSLDAKAYLQASLENPDTGEKGKATLSHTSNFMFDTYTARLSVTTNASFVNTSIAENDVNLAIGFWILNAGDNYTLPLGTNVTVRPAGSTDELPTRYCYAQGKGYVMANLGTQPAGDYLIEVKVSRYLADGQLQKAFAAPGSTADACQLNVALESSVDGLFFDEKGAQGIAGSIAWSNASFVPRSEDAYKPVYALDAAKLEKNESTGAVAYLKADEGTGIVSGVLTCTEDTDPDVEMTVLRRASDGTKVDITTGLGLVSRSDEDGRIVFRITDAPDKGTYDYEIRLGNTVYYQNALRAPGLSANDAG